MHEPIKKFDELIHLSWGWVLLVHLAEEAADLAQLNEPTSVCVHLLKCCTIILNSPVGDVKQLLQAERRACRLEPRPTGFVRGAGVRGAGV